MNIYYDRNIRRIGPRKYSRNHGVRVLRPYGGEHDVDDWQWPHRRCDRALVRIPALLFLVVLLALPAVFPLASLAFLEEVALLAMRALALLVLVALAAAAAAAAANSIG